MAAILKKGAFLNFQMATQLQKIVPVAIKTDKRTPIAFISFDFIIFLGPTPTCRCRMAAILKNDRHFGFSNGQSGKFDLKVAKNLSCVYHNFNECSIISYTIRCKRVIKLYIITYSSCFGRWEKVKIKSVT